MRRPGAVAAALVVVIVVVAGFAPLAAGRMATWVWDESTVLGAGPRRDLLAFAQAKGVDALFVHAATVYEEDRGFEALAQLVEAASRQQASLTLVVGDPSWSLPAHHSEALAALDRVRRIEARLAARGLSRPGRVLFDVEPYLLPAWRTAPRATAAAYVELLRLLQTAGRAAGLDVWHTIPFWFPRQTVGDRPLDALVLGSSAGVVVMAYRNRAADVESVAAPILERAATLNRPVIVAVETMCIDPPRTTFCGQTARALAEALDHIALALRASAAFAGLAVHKYASWATLDSQGR